MAKIKEGDFKITYNGTDVTRDIKGEVIYLSYIDRVEGESDELSIRIQDKSGKWRNQWYPEKMAKLELWIGWKNKMVPAGTFEIDEIKTSYNSSGFSIQINALSVIISAAYRTKRKRSFSNITLRRLANTIASEARLTVSGDIENIQIKFISQKNETDLGFLRRVSNQFGYIFSIKSDKLVFTNIGKLQEKEPVTTYDPTKLSEIEIDDGTDRTFKTVRQEYFNPETGKIEQYEHDTANANSAKNDTLILEGFVENPQQAELKAKAAAKRAENATVSGRIKLSRSYGVPLAGQNIEIIKIGAMSGVYHVEGSEHYIDSSMGYTIEADIFRVDLVDVSRRF